MSAMREVCVATIEPLPLSMRAKIKAKIAPRPDLLAVEVPIDVRVAKRPKVRVVSAKTDEPFPFKAKLTKGLLVVLIDPMEVKDDLRVWVRAK